MKRSKHSLSNYKILTCDMGELIPCNLAEVLPGDTFQGSSSALIRVSPLLAPVMHPVEVRIHHWFIPHRLVWDEWEDFITGGQHGTNSSTIPQVLRNQQTGTIYDYLGVPPAANNADISVSALPLRAYLAVYNEFYRDQDLVFEIDAISGSGDVFANSIPFHCAWQKDYFTSSRLTSQKGPSVSVTGLASQLANVIGEGVVESPGGTGANVSAGTFKVPVSAPVSIDVGDLRESLALQRYHEARSRYGSRYVEYLRYLGVHSSDARLQRPEYLGGGRQMISFSEVLQTSPDSASSTPVGKMAGHGVAALRTRSYRKFFNEHGYVLSLLSVRPKTVYNTGVHRTFNRLIKEDFYQRELEHIGQQPVTGKEIYGSGNPATDDATFGYQNRYDEYRSIPSTIAGDFRDTLNYWHMARDFTAKPTLNQNFVECYPGKRFFAEQTTDSLWCMVQNNLVARRMLSRTAKPSII